MRIFSLIVITILLTSCQKQKTYQDLEKNIDLRNNDYMNSFGIYAIDDENLPSHEEVDSIFNQIFPEYTKYTYRNERRSVLGYYTESLEALSGMLTPPSINYLSTYGYGLTKEEKKQLQQAKKIYALTIYGGKNDAVDQQKKTYELLAKLSNNKSYILVDFGTLEYFNPQSWVTKRVLPFTDKNPNIANQIIIRVNQKNNSTICRAATFGMEKFCLPDITISDFSCNNKDKIKTILELISQKLSENSFISSDSTLTITAQNIRNTYFNSLIKERLSTDSLHIKLSAIKPLKGDKNNSQYKIDFGIDLIDSEFITQLFNDNKMQFIPHTDEILKLSEMAKQKLPELKEAYHQNKLIDDLLLVKAPFVQNEDKEWMWVEVTAWKNMTITGKLYNSSNKITHLKSGVLVSIDQNDVFDYVIKKDDGSFEGNETEKLIRKEIKE